MKQVYFSENEKRVFRMIKNEEPLYHTKGITKDTVISAIEYLEEYGLVLGCTKYRGIVEARMTSKGYAYFEEYPRLENPTNEEEIKELQLNELKYKKRIHKQEDIIRYWKLANIATAVFSFVIGVAIVYFVK